MTLFKVGDELIRTARSSSYYTKGKTYVITYHSGNQCSVPDDTGSNHLWSEDYLKQRFVLKSEYKPTKNQRITALEEKVKYLESVVDSLTHKKWTEDDLNEIEAQTLTNNQKRAAIIEKAKKFVETYSKVGKSDYNGNGEGNDFYRTWYFVVEFFIKENKVTCVATRTNEKGHRVTVDKHTSVGRAKCAPSDVFNEHIGKAIALGRALGLDVSEFEQAVQPDEVVVGMEALVKGMISDYTTTVCKSDEGLKKNENSLGFIKSNPWFFKRITNDTDAVY